MPPQSEAFQKMMRAQMRAYNKQMYADVGAQLGLTREEVNKLIDLLTDQQVGRTRNSERGHGSAEIAATDGGSVA